MRAVAFDTETFLIAPGRPTPPLVCASFCELLQEPTLHHVRDGGAQRKWLDAVKDPDVVLVGHNVMYDLAVMIAACPDQEDALRAVFYALDHGRIRDTLMRQRIFHVRKGDLQYLKRGALTLAAMSKNYLGEEMKKGEDTWRLRYAELVDVPLDQWPHDASHYAKHDARQTLRVFYAQHELFERMKYLGKEPFSARDEVTQLKGAFALQLMQTWGIRTDAGRVAALERELVDEVNGYTSALQAAGVVRSDGSQSQSALAERIVAAYRRKGVEPPKTEKGAVSSSKETLEAVVDEDPILRTVYQRKHAEKILATFVEPAKAGTVNPITANFTPMLASTRTSCRGPNLQNLPKKAGVRECFVPRKGFVFADADYSTLEMRTFAQIMHELKLPGHLRKALWDGKDPHCLLGATVLGIGEDEFVRRLDAGDKHIKQTRSMVKAGNFGYMGGLGAAKFVAYVKQFGMTISLETAQAIKAGWMKRWETAGYFKWIDAHLDADTGFGNITLSSGLIRGACNYTVACNTPFQSRAAYGAKEALWQIARETYLDRSSDLYGSRNVNFIHDECLVEVPEEHASPAAARLKTVMEESMMVWTPDVPQSVVPALMRCWNKEAKPVLDDEGNLVPWDDEEAA